LSLSWARPIQSTPRHPISLRSTLILSIHFRLSLPSDLFPIYCNLSTSLRDVAAVPPYLPLSLWCDCYETTTSFNNAKAVIVRYCFVAWQPFNKRNYHDPTSQWPQ
jgi:hypothetical protein